MSTIAFLAVSVFALVFAMVALLRSDTSDGASLQVTNDGSVPHNLAFKDDPDQSTPGQAGFT